MNANEQHAKERKFHFCRMVGDLLFDNYDFEGGAQICHDLLQSGELSINVRIEDAAKIIAERGHKPGDDQ